MTRPPRFAVRLLDVMRLSEAEAIAGDLREEFYTHVVPRRGAMFAKWWFARQVAGSLGPLFFRAWQRASATRASASLLAAAVVGIVPATTLLSLRSFVLSQVPLKTDAAVSASFAWMLWSVTAISAGAGLVIGIRLLNGSHEKRSDAFFVKAATKGVADCGDLED
jgi:hypothetical protein